jgi:hypothetical protein
MPGSWTGLPSRGNKYKTPPRLGSHEVETVRYGHEFRGTRTQDSAGETINYRLTLSSEWAHMKNPSNISREVKEILVAVPKSSPDTRTDCPTDRWSYDDFDFDCYIPPRGGGIEYIHRSPASCKRHQKGNPARYGVCGSWTREWKRWQGPVRLTRV